MQTDPTMAAIESLAYQSASRQVGRSRAALAKAMEKGDLAAAGDLAYGLVVARARELGLRVDAWNGPGTCCPEGRSLVDSSRVTSERDGVLLVRSVHWGHRSRRVHTKRVLALLAAVRGGELVVRQGPPATTRVTKAVVASFDEKPRKVTE